MKDGLSIMEHSRHSWFINKRFAPKVFRMAIHSLILMQLACCAAVTAQTLQVHSHNDYDQTVPFWKAYAAGANSIEVDIFLEKGLLLVGHERAELVAERTLETLYLQPLEQAIAFGGDALKIQLLIDIKTEARATLDALVMVLEKYPSLLGNKDIMFVVSGNRPRPADYPNYPAYIFFDHQQLGGLEDAKVSEKVALISLNFKKYSPWNGKGRLVKDDSLKIASVITTAKAFGKPFRFWATPDSKTAWRTMAAFGVDFINTDIPFECAAYMQTLAKRVYHNTVPSAVYRPTFSNDAAQGAPENIILLIGDGNGLAQISATALSNNGALTLTQFKNIGFLTTWSSDDFTTDSAGAATAMATGKKVPNRYLGVDANGVSLPNLTELLSKAGLTTAIVTTDQITGATPAAFYAHQKERDLTEGIITDLQDSSLDLFVSASQDHPAMQNNLKSFEFLNAIADFNERTEGRLASFFPKSDTTLPLDSALITVLSHLNKRNAPFFAMVEGARIDSYGHANDIQGLVREGLAFDRAVAAALAFADLHGNTLVIVTADHETGGLTLPSGTISDGIIEADFTTDDHTGIFVPIFAYGPRSHLFQGVYGNHMLFSKVLRALDLPMGQ